MTSTEIHNKVKEIIADFSKEDFIYDLLLAYGTSRTSVTRLKKGDFNLSKKEGELLYKKKVFFKEELSERLLSTVESASTDENIKRHQVRFIIATDYHTIVAKDLRLGRTLDIKLNELPNYYEFFLPLAGAEVYQASNDNEADRNAAYKMAQLYDLLVTENRETYNSLENVHQLNIFLSRLLFCFFAEDTGIFDMESIFTNTLAQHTAYDGSDTNLFLNTLFDRLNSKTDVMYPTHFSAFPYVNGGLFKDKIDAPIFTTKARNMLIDLGELDWRNINPDIFGSMIQAVVIPEYRSDLGMHYTSVPNILRVIKPLFLDELYEEFEKCKTVLQLNKLIQRIAKIRFFDPACGSGNFLIITYKEIRRLEVEILKRVIEFEGGETLFVDSSIKLSQFYGIEIDDFAHEVAILSLWLAEHQMNQYFEDQLIGYTEHQSIIPLKKSGSIVQGNAARVNWETICPIDKEQECYIIGNPPYLGARMQDSNQKEDMSNVFRGINGYNNMDYISCWMYKGKKYIENRNAKLAFVSTSSICEGEQVSLLWSHLLTNSIEINFAYQPFKWVNNAKRNAGVTVIIVSLRNKSNVAKYLYSDIIKKEVKNINGYLLDAPNVVIVGRSKPLSNLSEMNFGSMPNDKGFLILNEEEKNQLIEKYPDSQMFIKRFMGGEEFLKGVNRYCLWIEKGKIEEALQIVPIDERINNVRKHRISSKREATKKLAKLAWQFGEVRYKETDSLIIARTSSERREYIPIGFLTKETIISDSAMAIYDAQPWLFGIIHSRIHMVWVRAVGGKLETRYRYSAKLCYNTFPFPDINIKQKETLNQYVFDVLDEREKHAEKTMAQLYDPDKMPAGLRLAHQALDEAVERCYRLQPFSSDSERLEYLFKLYEEMIARNTLFAKQKRTRKK